MLDEISKRNFSLGTREINIDYIIKHFENEIVNNSFKVQYYKQFLEKTDNSAIKLVKSISKLTEFFKEHKKFIESQNQIEYYQEVISNIARSCYEQNFEILFQKVGLLNNCLIENRKKYANSFTELVINPLEQLNKSCTNDYHREASKKSLDKSFRLFESKKNKGKKSLKDLTSNIYTSDMTRDYNEDQINLCLKTYEYLSQLNETKTSIFNQLYPCILNHMKLQHSYYEESGKYVSDFIQEMNELIPSGFGLVSTQEMNECPILVNFNFNQSCEKQALDEKLKLLRMRKLKMNRATSTPFLNSISKDNERQVEIKRDLSRDQEKYLNLASEQNISNNTCNNNNTNMKFKSSRKNSFQKTHDEQTKLSLFGQKRLKVIENFKEFKVGLHGNRESRKDREKLGYQHEFYDDNSSNKQVRVSEEKCGYLLKRALHTRMGKSWLKRKCAAENGFFYIYHSEENKEPIKLNLGLCEVKSIGDKRFQVYYPNERCFIFMADTEHELNDWVQVLNQAKKDFYNTGVKINGDVQTSSVLDRIKLLDGNSCCCDCGREEADWLVTNLGVLVCIYCCGIHRDLGVHVSKTQSIKIDRLSPTQLIIATLIGNAAFNRIYEANLLMNQKLTVDCTTEMRYKFIKDKYERHKFIKHEIPFDKHHQMIEFAKVNSREKTFEVLLQLFGQNINLLAPIAHDHLKRNLLQLSLIYLEEDIYVYIMLFIVQNRDFTKSMYTIDYQDAKGFTALHYSAIYNRIESAKILLKVGIDVSRLNDYNQTAYDVAHQYSNIELANQIKLHSEGKPIDLIKWSEPQIVNSDEELLSDSLDDDKPEFNELPFNNYNNYNHNTRVQRIRPMSMIESKMSILL